MSGSDPTSDRRRHPAPDLRHRFAGLARAVAREAAGAFERTPLEVLLGAVAAIGFSAAIELEAMETWSELLVMVGIALPLVHGASALRARGAVGALGRWGIAAAALAGGALYAELRFDPALESEVWRAWLLVGAAVSALFTVPMLDPAPAAPLRARLFGYGERLVTRTAVVMLYAVALWVGLAAAIAAVNGLFELELEGEAYAHLAGLTFMLLPPWAVAAGLPELAAAGRLPVPAPPAAVLQRRAGVFLLLPLIAVYLLIAYAYAIRVIATGEVPKNLISPVVIGAGILIVASTLFLERVHADPDAAGASWMTRLAAPLLLPLVLLAIWAVGMRIDQYGWTEFRYVRSLTLGLLALYAAAAALRLLRGKRPPLTWVPAILGIVLLLAAVGPWSAPAVAHASQAAALRRLLPEAGRRGAADAPTAVPTERYEEIRNKAIFLEDHFGWDALRDAVPRVGPAPVDSSAYAVLSERLGIVEELGAAVARIITARVPHQAGIPGVGPGTLYNFPLGRIRPGVDQDVGGVMLRVDTVAARVSVRTPDGERLSADLVPLLTASAGRAGPASGTPVYERHGGRPDHSATVERMVDVEIPPFDALVPLLDAAGRSRGQLVVRSLTFRIERAAARPRMQMLDAMVLLMPAG